MKREDLERGPDVRCPVCREAILDSGSGCDRCATIHHADCWEYLGGCAIYGCAGSPAGLDAARKDASPVSGPAPGIRGGGSALVAAGLVGFFAALFFVWPPALQLSMTEVSAGDGWLLLDWTTSRPVPCELEIARDPEFARIVVRHRTTGSVRHGTVSVLEPGRRYHYRVRAIDLKWGGEGLARGSVRIPDAPDAAPPPPAGPTARGPVGNLPTRALEARDSGALWVLVPGARARDDRVFRRVRLHRDAVSGRLLVSWHTTVAMDVCRLVLSRDGSLRGLVEVVDSVPGPAGRSHRVLLPEPTGDAPHTFLLLGMGRDGASRQSPVMTLASNASE